jgi:integrase
MQARGLSSRTVRYTHQIMHHVLQHAVAQGLIPANPARDARPQTSWPAPSATLKPEELRRFLQVAQSSDHAALWFLLATGIRPSEARALKWEAVNLKRGRVRIDSSLRLLPSGRFEVFPLRSPSQRREVILPETAIRVLRDHRSRQRRQRKAAGSAWEEHGLVMTSSLGRPLNWATASRTSLKALLRRARLPMVSGYGLFHACVATLLEQGVDLQTVSRQTGYAKLGTLLDSRRLLTQSVTSGVPQSRSGPPAHGVARKAVRD